MVKLRIGSMLLGVLCFASTALCANMGVDEIYWSGSEWSRGDNVNPDTQYTSAAYNTRHTYKDSFMGARSDGGIQETYYNGGWTNELRALTGNTYTDLTYNTRISNTDVYYGTRSDGGVEVLYYSGGWNAGARLYSDTQYNAVAYNSRHSCEEGFMVALASGGVMEIWYADGAWNHGWISLTDYVFTDLAYNSSATNTDFYYGVRADGGVQEIYYSGSWQVGDLVNPDTLYTAVAHNSKGDNILVARADGGLEQVVYSGGWNTSSVFLSDKVYVDLAYNPNQPTHNDFYYGAVIPEPATMGLLAVGGLGVLIRRKR